MLSSNSAARRLVEALVAKGIDTFFGIPGGPICPIFEAIRLTPGAHLVESRHETSAAFAAALYYKGSGRIPVVVVTAGPGATNVITGVTSAYMERVPMLVIVGDVAWATSGNRLAQDTGLEGINIDSMLASVTKAQVRASHSRSVVSQAMSALDSACQPGNQGPALFVLALDHAMGECPYINILPGINSSPKLPEPDNVTMALGLLRGAKRPLVVLGAGCREHAFAVRWMLDNLDVPFVTTPRAKGIASETHPNSLRNGGLAASVWAQNYTEHPIDVCLVLGTDLDDSSIGPTRYCSPDGTLIHVDTDSRVFGRNMPTKFGIVADVGAFASLMAMKASQYPPRYAYNHLQLIKQHKPFQDFVVGDQIHPAEILLNLQHEMPSAKFITDIGEHMLFAMHYLTADSADDFHIQLNLGSMGSGIAGSIGLAMCSDRPVVCIAGDGGMQMSGMEALVAIREGLPILFTVFNDGRYNMVHHGMRQIFGEAEEYGTVPIDFSVWASSFGLQSQVVKNISDIDYTKIKSVLDAREPYLLDVRVNPSAHMSGGGRIAALQRMSMSLTGEKP